MHRGWACVVFNVLLLAATASAAPATTQATTGPATTRSALATTRPRSPADAVRALLLFMVDNDRAGIEAVIVRNPHAPILWSGEPPPPERRDGIVQSIETLAIHELDSGAQYFLDDGRTRTVKDDDIGKERRMVVPMFPNNPRQVPIIVKRVDGAWRVDAEPFIDARKAAEARRQRIIDQQKIRRRIR